MLARYTISSFYLGEKVKGGGGKAEEAQREQLSQFTPMLAKKGCFVSTNASRHCHAGP